MTPSADSNSTPFPPSGRLMGLDFGTKRVGIAVSDPDQNIASPLENYTRRDVAQDARRLNALASEYAVAGVVVGLPVHTSGQEGQKAREARQFGHWVQETTGLPLLYWDERYSSVQAEQHLIEAGLSRKKRKQRTDKLAAQIMLQSFLDSGDRHRPADSLFQ